MYVTEMFVFPSFYIKSDKLYMWLPHKSVVLRQRNGPIYP